MTDIFIAFITGLTTGGLSCLAVQGGLLASSLAYQLEQDITPSSVEGKTHQPRIALPILLFLAAKLVAYAILGFLLGALGSVLQLTPFSRAVLFIAIGIFMIGNALRMVNVHPIFRYFAFEPPSFITRYIRRRAKNGGTKNGGTKNGGTWITPLFLGVLTVLIPCGITQAMMAVALGSGSPLFGAAIMFSFVLGTTPVFFSLAYFAAKLGSRMEKAFMRVVAIVLLILGVLSIDSGLNLMGSPYSLANLNRNLLPAGAVFQGGLAGAEPVRAAAPTPNGGYDSTSAMPCGCRGNWAGNRPQRPAGPPTFSQNPGAATPLPGAAALNLNALNNGYEPAELRAPADTPLTLNVVTANTVSCSRAFVIPALNVEVILPESGTTPINIPPQKSGTVMRFSCSMGMYTGQITFE